MCDSNGNEHDCMVIDKLRTSMPGYPEQDMYLAVKKDGSTFYGNFIKKVYMLKVKEQNWGLASIETEIERNTWKPNEG